MHSVKKWVATDLLSDIVFWIDIVFNFRTSYMVNGQYIRSPKLMAIQYLKGHFVWDILASVPLEIVGYSWDYYPWWRLPRYIRFIRFNYYIAATGYLLPSLKIFFELFRILIYTFLVSHLSGCAYMWVILVQPTVNMSFQVGEVDITKKSFWRQYLRAFYWGFSMFSGYANTQPETNLEYGVSLIVAVVGMLIYALIIGLVGLLLSQYDAMGEEFQRRMESLQAFMNYRRLPSAMKAQILKYYNYIWHTRKSLNEAGILEELPLNLRTEVALFFNKDIIAKVPFFADLEPQFINSIVLKLKPKVALPQSLIIKKNDIGREMFFISRGEVEVVSEPNEKGERTVWVTLKEGSFFGEVALINNAKRGASIRAKDFCDLFVFTKADFQEALKTFPESVKQQIMDIANQRNQAQKK